MIDFKENYDRLTGFGENGLSRNLATYFNRNQVLLADDHILDVESSGYMETYRRYYFKHIQGLWVAKNWYWHISTFLLLVAVLGLVAILFSAENDVAIRILLVCTGVFLGIFLYHLMLGPSGRLYVMTAIQTRYLPGIKRKHSAEKAMEILSRRIHHAQANVVVNQSEEVPQPDMGSEEV